MAKQIRIPINFKLDLVRPNRPVTSDGRLVMYRCKDKEEVIFGWMILATLDGHSLDCLSCRNGKDGQADAVNSDGSTSLVFGNIKTFFCLPYEKSGKLPKIEVFISNKTLEKEKVKI
jgi:hypothetical protein